MGNLCLPGRDGSAPKPSLSLPDNPDPIGIGFGKLWGIVGSCGEWWEMVCNGGKW